MGLVSVISGAQAQSAPAKHHGQDFLGNLSMREILANFLGGKSRRSVSFGTHVFWRKIILLTSNGVTIKEGQKKKSTREEAMKFEKFKQRKPREKPREKKKRKFKGRTT